MLDDMSASTAGCAAASGSAVCSSAGYQFLEELWSLIAPSIKSNTELPTLYTMHFFQTRTSRLRQSRRLSYGAPQNNKMRKPVILTCHMEPHKGHCTCPDVGTPSCRQGMAESLR